MTHLRKMTLEELERRNYTETTTRAASCHEVSRAISTPRRTNSAPQKFANLRPTFPCPETRRQHRQPESPRSASSISSAQTVLEHRRDALPQKAIHLPVILSQDEVTRLIERRHPFHRTILMTLYATGVRRAELTRLNLRFTASDGHPCTRRQRTQRSRYHAQPESVDALREHYRSLRRKPETWLFPGGKWHTADLRSTPKLSGTPAVRLPNVPIFKKLCILIP